MVSDAIERYTYHLLTNVYPKGLYSELFENYGQLRIFCEGRSLKVLYQKFFELID